MKRLFIIIGILALAAVSAAETQNLVKNSDLKQLSASGGPGGWYVRPATAPVKRVQREDGESFALRLASPSGERIFVIQNSVPVKKGGKYMLSIAFRGKPGTKARFYIEGGRSGKDYWTEAIHIACRNDKWVSAQHPFTAKGDNPHIVMAQLSAGEIEFAEPQVYAYEAPENKDGNLLKNADFTFGGADGGVQGWALRTEDSEVTRFKREEGDTAIRMVGSRALLIQNGVPAKKGERYLLCITFRGKPDTRGRFYIEGGSEANGSYWTKAIHIKTSDAEKWQTVQLPFTADGDNPHVVMALLSKGTIEFAAPKVVPAPKKKSDNLLTNADFATTLEQGGKKIPMLWDAKNNAQIEVVKTDIGNVVRMQSLKEHRSHLVQNNLELQKGKEYQFSVRYRGTPGTTFLYGAEGGGWGILNRNIKCQKDWKIASIRIRLPEKAKGTPYAVFATEPKGGYVELSNPQVIEVEPGFSNGDFSKGAKSWIFENAEVVDRNEHTKCVKLNGTQKTARIVQSGLLLEKGKNYELGFDARGGDDRRFTDGQNATWYRIALYYGGEPFFGSGKWLDSFERWQHKSLRFTALRDMSVDVVGELRDPGTVYFANITLKEIASIAPALDIVLDAPWIYTRGAEFGTKGEFSGSVFVAVKGDKLRITFDGREQLLNYAPEVRFNFAIPSEPGRKEIKIELLDADGKTTATAAEHFTVRGKAPDHHSHVVTLDKQHRMFVDGKPFFAIGCWGNRGPVPREESYYMLSDMGFNLVLCGSSSLDAIDAAGMYGMVGMNSGKLFKAIPEKEKLEHVIQLAEGYKKTLAHPALLCYFSTDEPSWRGVQLEPYQNGYRLFRDYVDPWRPVYLNEAPRGTSEALRPSGDACDLYGIDIYPIPPPNPHSELEDKGITSVGKYTDMCRVTVRDRKPVWMTLQAFSWEHMYHRPNEVYPTLEENRFMAYDSIAHGATGLMYYGIWFGKGSNEKFLADLKTTIHELTAAAPFIVGDTVEGETATSTPDIRVMQKRTAEHGDLWIVLNESAEKRQVELKGKFPANIAELSGKTMPAPDGGKLAFELPAYEVRVFRDADKPMPKPLYVPKPKRKFEKFKSLEGYRQASWIWYPGTNSLSGAKAFFRQDFEIGDRVPEKAELSVAGDDMFRCWINGELVMEQMGWQDAHTLDVAKYLKPGKNTIRIQAADAEAPPCGLLYAIVRGDGKPIVLSGKATEASLDGKDNWKPAQIIAPYGKGAWLSNVSAKPYKPSTQKIPLPKE